jgi:GNAT superfamily N-acetyltransferase
VGSDADAISIRPAVDADYQAFTRLFPELGVDDPLPTSSVWASAFVPYTRVATEGAEILGYCYAQQYDDTGYVRHLVVAPAARRRGVARALMQATAHHLRAAGKTGWRLNVGSGNAAAIALYEGLGLQTLYASRVVRVTWASASALPATRAVVHELPSVRDAEIERLFALPRGQLAAARGTTRLILIATTPTDATAPTGACAGLAVFSPSFPGAFPFRVLEHGAVRALLEAMRPHVPDQPHVNLVIDDDEALVSRLVAVGAEVRAAVLHLGGAL